MIHVFRFLSSELRARHLSSLYSGLFCASTSHIENHTNLNQHKPVLWWASCFLAHRPQETPPQNRGRSCNSALARPHAGRVLTLLERSSENEKDSVSVSGLPQYMEYHKYSVKLWRHSTFTKISHNKLIYCTVHQHTILSDLIQMYLVNQCLSMQNLMKLSSLTN